MRLPPRRRLHRARGHPRRGATVPRCCVPVRGRLGRLGRLPAPAGATYAPAGRLASDSPTRCPSPYYMELPGLRELPGMNHILVHVRFRAGKVHTPAHSVFAA